MTSRNFLYFGLSMAAMSFASAHAQVTQIVSEKAYACLKSEGEKTIPACTDVLRTEQPWGFLRANILVQRGIAYRRAKQEDLARQDFRDATEFKPDGTNGYMVRAVAYRSLGDNP